MHSFDSWEDFCDYMFHYGAQIVILTFLSAVTVYRREMSCNRVFHQDDEVTKETDKIRFSKVSDEMECETEDLLDGAGLYYSFAPLLSFLSVWVDCFACDSCIEESQIIQSPSESNNNLWDEVRPADLLERAGNYCSGEPIWAAAAFFRLNPRLSAHMQLATPKIAERRQYDSLPKMLPPDVHVQIASFLHPRDVVALGSVDDFYRSIVNTGETSTAIWKTLWYRDYAWIVHVWDVGQQALQRSETEFVEYSKEFYFLFGLAYLEYVLAGQNKADRCLVGLHSDIYDITAFLPKHPGSIDTLMAYSGRDATSIFEDMRHSMVARRLAKPLCVVVDASSSKHACGLHPTIHTNPIDGFSVPSVMQFSDNVLLGRKEQQRLRPGTLEQIRNKYKQDYEQVGRKVQRKFGSNQSVLGQPNHYYDPFCQEWRVWYTNTNLQPVFTNI